MKNLCVLFILSILIIGCSEEVPFENEISSTEKATLVNNKKTNLPKVNPEDYIFFESPDLTKKRYVDPETNIPVSSNPFNINNKIFLAGKTFKYDYHIVKDGEYRFLYPHHFACYTTCDLTPKGEQHQDEIKSISIKINDLKSLRADKTIIPKTLFKVYFELGDTLQDMYFGNYIIENEKNVVMYNSFHQTQSYLKILPDAFIKAPFTIGNKWEYVKNADIIKTYEKLGVKEGEYRVECNYEIKDFKKVDSNLGSIDCYIIEGRATGKFGTTKTVTQFNEEHGFVKMIYTLPNGTEVHFYQA